MPDGEAEREPENDAGLLGTVVALLCELLEEVVASDDTNLSQGQVPEGGHDEGLHVPLIQLQSAPRQPVFAFEVFEPLRDQVREGAVRREH